MRTLADLPYRFWPNDKLPEGVPKRSGIVTLKAAKFTKPYRQAVVPVLRGLGFEAKDTKAKKIDDKLWRTVEVFIGGGYASVVLGAHLPGLPGRLDHEPLPLTSFDQSRSISKYKLQLTAKVDAYNGAIDEFDLGFTDEHATETAALMAEAVAEQFGPQLARLDQMEATLLAVAPDDWEAPMTAHYQTFALRLTTDSVFRGLPQLEVLALLARMHARAGNAMLASRFAELALVVLAKDLRERPYHGGFWYQLNLEKLRDGRLTFEPLSEDDKAEVMRRLHASFAARAESAAQATE